MDPTQDTESALIIVCPEAESAVGQHRGHLDRAAQFGVPAHVTVTSPFIPPSLLDADSEACLEQLFSRFSSFTMHASRTEWFADHVLFVALEDPSRVIDLTNAVTRAFPEYPPYGGAFDEVTPHLTIGHGQPRATLEESERDVMQRLPFEQRVDCIELWAGPSTGGEILADSWRRIRAFRLG